MEKGNRKIGNKHWLILLCSGPLRVTSPFLYSLLQTSQSLLSSLVRLFDRLGIPLLYFGGSALKGNLFTEPFPFSSLQSLIVALVFTAILGPVEGFGLSWNFTYFPAIIKRL
jgi:hypothetical protein